MGKSDFRKVYEAIDVPEFELKQAIRQGIQEANAPKKVFRWSSIGIYVGVTCSLIIGTFFISPISEVLANVPVIGSFYSRFNDLIGKELEEKTLITELHQEAKDNGFTVTISDAYFDGGAIGIRFEINGDIQSNHSGDFTTMYEIFKGDSAITETTEIAYLEKTNTGYQGHLTLYYPAIQITDNFKVPLEFKQIGEQVGSWQFNIPVKQLPYRTIELKEKQENDTEQITLEFTSAFVGQASVTINYTATFLNAMRNNQVRLEFYDENGQQLDDIVNGIRLKEEIVDENVVIQGRAMILFPIAETSSFIKVVPKVAMEGHDPNRPIELSSFNIYFE